MIKKVISNIPSNRMAMVMANLSGNGFTVIDVQSGTVTAEGTAEQWAALSVPASATVSLYGA